MAHTQNRIGRARTAIRMVCAHGPHILMAPYSYGPIYLWPHIVMAPYSYGMVCAHGQAATASVALPWDEYGGRSVI